MQAIPFTVAVEVTRPWSPSNLKRPSSVKAAGHPWRRNSHGKWNFFPPLESRYLDCYNVESIPVERHADAFLFLVDETLVDPDATGLHILRFEQH